MKPICYVAIFTGCLLSGIDARKIKRQTDAPETKDKEQLENRFYLQNLPNYDCYTRLRDPGRCISLRDCPLLRDRVRNFDRVYILQAVSDYVCGYESTVKVCCPDKPSWTRPQGTYLRPPQDSWQNRPGRPEQSDTFDRPNRPNQVNESDDDDDDEWERPNNRPNDWDQPSRPSNRPWWEQPADNKPNQGSGWDRPTDNRPNQGSGWDRPTDNRPNQGSGWDRPTDNRPNQGSGWDRPTDNRPNQGSGWDRPTDNRPNQGSGWDRPTDNRPNTPKPRPTDRPNQSGWWDQPAENRPKPTPGSEGNPDRRPYQFPGNDPEPESTTLQSTPSQGGGSTSSVSNHRNRRLLPKTCGTDLMSNRVLFGNNTALGEYPWVALLRIRFGSQSTFGCGGSLIHPRYVLTAAHCVNIAEMPSAKVDQVRLGEHDTRADPDCEGKGEFRECSGAPQNIEVEEKIVHRGYVASSKSQANDIALLRLKRPAVVSKFVMPICLPLDDIADTNYDEKSMWVAGWGRTTNDPNSNSPIKQKVSLPVVPVQKCKPIYKNSAYKLDLSESQMCAGGGKADSCRGDSGGPLMSLDQVGATFRWHVQGVVSIGPNKCGTIGMPGIYSRIASFLPWILDNIKD